MADANNIKGFKGIVPVNDTNADFYTINPNPYNDSNALLGSMADGETLDFTWEVNATGNYAAWTFFVFGEGSQYITMISPVDDEKALEGFIKNMEELKTIQ